MRLKPACHLIFGVLISLAHVARASAEDGCHKFAWPLLKERAAFAAIDKKTVAAGDTLTTAPAEAFVLALRPGEQASFTLPPERKPKAASWFGGSVHFGPAGKAGLYQIALSDEAWVDVVQDGRYARSVGHSGRGDCPGLRKAVRFELSAAPFVVQVSGAEVDRIAMIVEPVE